MLPGANRLTVANAPCQAVGVVEGTFIPERHLLIGADGQHYKASLTGNVARWYAQKPEEAAKARFFICWPRTTKADGIHLTVVGAPTDPERQASLKREAGQFKVAGVVTNQKSRRNKVIVRVARDESPPKDRRRWSQHRSHLLFLSGRAAPAVDFTNHHTVFTCELKEQQLVIRRIEGRQKVEVVPIEIGGVKWPWPFHSGRRALEQLRDFNLPKGQKTFLAVPPYHQTLGARLERLDQLIAMRKSIDASAEESITTDRLKMIARRIRTYVRKMGDFELSDLLAATGLHVVLGRIQLDAPEPAAPEPQPQAAKKAKAKPAAAAATPALPADLEPLAQMLLQGLPDLILREAPGMSAASLRSGVAQLVELGWYDRLSPEEQALARTSFQLRKAVKGR